MLNILKIKFLIVPIVNVLKNHEKLTFLRCLLTHFVNVFFCMASRSSVSDKRKEASAFKIKFIVFYCDLYFLSLYV